MIINIDFINYWAAKYPVNYDERYYDPFIIDARGGDPEALRRITEWKNVGGCMCPMRLSKKKENAFQFFIDGLHRYLQTGSEELKGDFAKRAPVYSIFWHHILFDTPIFDVHTNRSFVFFTKGIHLRERAAAIRSGSHWCQYAQYCIWFEQQLTNLRKSEIGMTARHLDRALFMWGKNNKGSVLR